MEFWSVKYSCGLATCTYIFRHGLHVRLFGVCIFKLKASNARKGVTLEQSMDFQLIEQELTFLCQALPLKKAKYAPYQCWSRLKPVADTTPVRVLVSGKLKDSGDDSSSRWRQESNWLVLSLLALNHGAGELVLTYCKVTNFRPGYPFSYFWLETGSYKLTFVLSRASKQNYIDIRWRQDKNKFSSGIKFRTFFKSTKLSAVWKFVTLQ